MFPVTHALMAVEATGHTTELDLLLVGAIFPDAVISDRLGWSHTHHCGRSLYHFLAREHPHLLPFAEGVATHGLEPAGLDYWGDERYLDGERGYSFQHARPFIADVVAVTGVPEEHGWWKAHNFVEMAIEWRVARQQQWLGPRLARACRNSLSIRSLERPLEQFFGLATGEWEATFAAFAPLIEFEPLTPDRLAIVYERQVQHKHGLASIDVPGAALLIERCAAAVTPSFAAFWRYARQQIRISLQALRSGA